MSLYANCKIKACLLLDISLSVLNCLLSVALLFLTDVYRSLLSTVSTVMIMNTRRQTY